MQGCKACDTFGIDTLQYDHASYYTACHLQGRYEWRFIELVQLKAAGQSKAAGQ